MISHEHKFIFIHVPRTGGTSIEKLLDLSGARHNTARQYRDHNPEAWLHYFSFAFVRNPWDRMLSFFTYRRQIRQLETESSLSFKHWLLLTAELIRSEDHVALNPSFAPHFGGGTIEKDDPEGWRVKVDNAIHMLTDERGKIIVNFVGRYERLQDDFDTICDRLGLGSMILPHINKTEHDHYRKYYDEDSKRIVEELFSADIAHFDYSF